MLKNVRLSQDAVSSGFVSSYFFHYCFVFHAVLTVSTGIFTARRITLAYNLFQSINGSAACTSVCSS